jgi:hypothetical protein
VKDELSEDSQDGACILSALRIPLEELDAKRICRRGPAQDLSGILDVRQQLFPNGDLLCVEGTSTLQSLLPLGFQLAG